MSRKPETHKIKMASTIREEDETKEFFDSPEELEAKVSQLADWIRQSKHFIAFTVSPALAVDLPAIYNLHQLFYAGCRHQYLSWK